MSEAPPLSQSAEFAAALARIGRPALRLPDGTLVLTRRFAGMRLGLISHAPLPGRATLQAAGLGQVPLLVTPDRPDPVPGAMRIVTPVHWAALALTQGPEALFRGLHQKWRNRLRHARRSGLVLRDRPLDSAAGRWLLRADAAQQRRRGYRTWPAALTLGYGSANPGQARLMSAERAGEIVAAVLILCHGRAATFHLGHSTALGKSLSAHNLLIWNAISDLSAQGYQRFDLGPVNTEDAPGLARFKLGTGATARPLGGTWLCWPPLARRGKGPQADPGPSSF